MTAIFIDGPLRSETKEIDACPEYRVALPKRLTFCSCYNEDFPDEHEIGPEIFTYHAVMVSVGEPRIALMSKHKANDNAIIDQLKAWIMTDLRDDMHRSCRSRRAYE